MLKKIAFELGMRQALKDVGLIKTSLSTEEMKDNVFSQQQRGQKIDAFAPSAEAKPPSILSTTSRAVEKPFIGGSVGSGGLPRPEAVMRTALKNLVPTSNKAPGQKGPSQYGAEIYEKGFGPGGALERRRAAQRAALNL